jgi:hypothetical protein
MKRLRTLTASAVFLLLSPAANASTLPFSNPNSTSFTAFVDSGTSSDRVSGGAWNILPICTDGSESWCIKSLEVSSDEKNFKLAKFVRYVDNGIRPPSPSQNIIPIKSAISIWSVENSNGKVNLYAAHSVVGSMGIFSSSIYAFKEIKSQFRDDVYNQMSYGKADYRLINPGYIDDCVFVSQGICGQRVSTENVSFRLTQFIGSEYSTWFAGRIIGGSFNVTKVQNNQSKLVVVGNSVKVPEILLEQPGVDRQVLTDCVNPLEPTTPKISTLPDFFNQSLCARAKSDYDMCFPVNKWEPGNFFREECNYQTTMYSKYYSANPFYNYLSFELPTIKGLKGSTFEPEIWTFQSNAAITRSSCLEDVSFLGAANSNALLFDAYPPLLIDGKLNYRVSSPHLNSANLENKGVFEVQLNSDVLRCMYNFTKAPIEVKVTITTDDGESQIATTNWSESEGISRLTISAFHYSSPKIQVSFTQKKNLQSSISCIKGKLTKKVNGVSPKCPTGYKLK